MLDVFWPFQFSIRCFFNNVFAAIRPLKLPIVWTEASFLRLHSLLTCQAVNFGFPVDILKMFLSALLSNFYRFKDGFAIKTLPVVSIVFWMVSENSKLPGYFLLSHRPFVTSFMFCFNRHFSHDFNVKI